MFQIYFICQQQPPLHQLIHVIFFFFFWMRMVQICLSIHEQKLIINNTRVIRGRNIHCREGGAGQTSKGEIIWARNDVTATETITMIETTIQKYSATYFIIFFMSLLRQNSSQLRMQSPYRSPTFHVEIYSSGNSTRRFSESEVCTGGHLDSLSTNFLHSKSSLS